MDALMEIEGIDALQWTSGDAGPDGTLPDWDVIYDKAIAAGKSIWVKVYSCLLYPSEGGKGLSGGDSREEK